MIKKIFLVVTLFLIVVFIVFWIQFSSESNRIFTESDAFKTTVQYVYNDSLTQERIGQIVKIDSSVSGYLTHDESARLVFDIYTSKQQEVTVKCRLQYEKDQWLIEEIEYH